MTFETLDKQLNKVKTNLIQVTKETKFVKKAEFQHILSRKEIDDLHLSYAGIYLIEIKTRDVKIEINEWKKQMKKLWDVKRLKLKHTPTTKVKRFKNHNKINPWMPLYIGKSKDIKCRLNEHFHLKLNNTTFALKLGIRKEFKEDVFKLSVIKLPVHNYDMIAPVVESHFRDALHPIVGKQ